MKEGIIHGNITIPADNQPAIITQPRKSPLNLIATFITSQLTPIIILLSLIVAPVWANQFNASLSQTLSQRVTVISPVGNQASGISPRTSSARAPDSNIFYRSFEQRNFARGRRVHVVSTIFPQMPSCYLPTAYRRVLGIPTPVPRGRMSVAPCRSGNSSTPKYSGPPGILRLRPCIPVKITDQNSL